MGNRLGQLVIDNDIHPQLVSPARHSPGNENLFICSNICFYPSPSSQPTVSGWDRAKVRLGDWKAVKWHWDDTSDICKHNKTPGHWHHQPQSGDTQWHHTAPIQKVSSAPQLQCSMSVPRGQGSDQAGNHLISMCGCHLPSLHDSYQWCGVHCIWCHLTPDIVTDSLLDITSTNLSLTPAPAPGTNYAREDGDIRGQLMILRCDRISTETFLLYKIYSC